MPKVTGAYFSPSGGTLRAAQLLVGLLDGPVVWRDLLDREQRKVVLGAEDLLVLALPVYAGRIPAVEGLLDGLKGENTPCVLLAAYGNRHYDEALAQMNAKLTGQGFRCVGAAAVITPHIFAPELGAGRPDEQDTAKLEELVRQVLAALEPGRSRTVSLPGDPEPEPKQAVPVPKYRDAQRCLHCGACARICPTGAMDPDTLEWDTGRCISCMACVCRCPAEAMGFDSAPLAQRLTANFSQPRAVEVFY